MRPGEGARRSARVPATFEAFFEREHPSWLRYARAVLGGRHDAEDVVQNAGMELLQNWQRALTCEGEEAMRAFALRIVKNKIADLRRREERDRRRQMRLEQECDRASRLQSLGGDLSERALLACALRELEAHSPQWYDVVRMRQSDLPFSLIAKTLYISVSTAKNHHALGARFLERWLTAADDHGDRD